MDAQSIYVFPANAFKVQRITAKHFVSNKRAYCLNELGTGKTRSALFAYDWLRQLSIVNKLLVICPISAMARTWGDEITNQFPHLKYSILHGSKATRLDRLKQDVDIYIINHDGVKTIKHELIKNKDIDCVVVDELAVYRDGGSNRTMDLKLLLNYKTWAWGLTGSPIPHAPTDVWGPCSALTPYSVPSSFHHFRAQLMIKKTNFKWIPKPNSEARALACMQPSVRFKLEDVTELPERVIHYYETTLTPSQRTAYEDMRKRAITLYKDHKIDALNAGAVLAKLLQISLGYAYTRKGETVTFDNTPRLQLILDLIDSSIKKVILFVGLKAAVDAFSQMLDRNKVDHAIVTGDVSIPRRNVIFREFQSTDKYKVLLAHPVCMSHSLTLTAASTTIWAGPFPSLDVFYQANARTYRVGQTSKTLIALVGATAAEQRIYKILGDNERLQDRFLEILEAQTEGEMNDCNA